jgi:hypothetical protein
MICRRFNVPVLDCIVLVIIASDNNFDEAVEEAAEFLGWDAENIKFPNFKDQTGRRKRMDGWSISNSCRSCICFFAKPTVRLLVHESVHCADNMIKELSLPDGLGVGASELRATLSEYLVARLLKLKLLDIR